MSKRRNGDLGTLALQCLVCLRGWREKATLLRRRQKWMTQVVHFVNLEGKRPSFMGAVDILFLTHSHREHGEQCHQFTPLLDLGNFLGGSDGKESASKTGDLVFIPGSGRSLEKEMATHSSILAWEIPWTEEPGGLQSMGSQKTDATQQLKKQMKSTFALLLNFWNYQEPQLFYTILLKWNKVKSSKKHVFEVLKKALMFYPVISSIQEVFLVTKLSQAF